MNAPLRPSRQRRVARHLLWLLVVTAACIYAAPNLYLPDPALRITPAPFGDPPQIGSRFAGGLETWLAAQNLPGTVEPHESGLTIRFDADATQQAAQARLNARLNPLGEPPRFVVAMERATTAPDWLGAVGARPLTLGLDLAGGIQLTLQVATCLLYTSPSPRDCDRSRMPSSA